jgi:hypothetical protein
MDSKARKAPKELEERPETWVHAETWVPLVNGDRWDRRETRERAVRSVRSASLDPKVVRETRDHTDTAGARGNPDTADLREKTDSSDPTVLQETRGVEETREKVVSEDHTDHRAEWVLAVSRENRDARETWDRLVRLECTGSMDAKVLLDLREQTETEDVTA